jgi:hypothetical protein
MFSSSALSRLTAAAVLHLNEVVLASLLLHEPEAVHATAAKESRAHAEGRVEDVEGEAADDDETTLEADEEVLLLHQRSVPALGKLGDTEDTSDENASAGEGQGDEEATELGAAAHLDEFGVLVKGLGAKGTVTAESTEGEESRGNDEAGSGGDLESKTSNHDVGAELRVIIAASGETTTTGLEKKGHNIAGDELGESESVYVLFFG